MLKKRKTIGSLTRMLIVIAILSAVAIVGLTSIGMSRLYSRQVINMAEKEAIVVSKLLVDHNRETLFSQRGTEKLHLQIDSLDISALNQSFSEFLHPLDIVKIKIFDSDTKVIYSTDNVIIGEYVQNNHSFSSLQFYC